MKPPPNVQAIPFDPNLWTGRTDAPGDQRWYQIVQQTAKGETLAPKNISLLGFCSDEGVRRNQGRTGAVDGPDALRQALAGLPWRAPDSFQLSDEGSIGVKNGELEAAQNFLALKIFQLLHAGNLPIVLGGGHETAWGSFMGLRKAYGAQPHIGILNLDAHFDLRKPSPLPTSGTPFYQAASWSGERATQFSYLCLGIQEMSNPASLFAQAEELGVQWISAEEIQNQRLEKWLPRVEAFLHELDYLYLTIDLDGFSGAFAPGVSAVNPLGLDPRRLLPLLRMLAQSGKVALIDVCELNPSLDQDQRTAKLGASLIWEMVRHLKE